jgi:hypothetical protein
LSLACAPRQVCVGELAVARGAHANLTTALTAALHLIVSSVAAFVAALLVQDVRLLA